MSSVQNYLTFKEAKATVDKSVKIEIALPDLETLKKSNYKLCFAKKVGDKEFNVVWQSYHDYLMNNNFSWTPEYQLFGSNIFQGNVRVQVSTNVIDLGLGQTSILSPEGILSPAFDGGPEISLTMDNEFGTIHPGVNQLSTGLNGERISTPIYVAKQPIVQGSVALTPVEKILVWFEQNIQTSTMFSDARSKAVEIDLTSTNSATRLYTGGKWIVPK